ncbi:MAG: hypothetical protein ACREA9_25650 [Pyrinomonadaceae bacterium]
MASIHDILRPITFTKVVSRIAAASSQFLNFMGMQPGGANEANYGHGREGSYHIFNNVRTVALGTAPGSPAARRSRNPVGRVPFVYPRMHQQLSLLLEEIHNFAKIDDPRTRDINGENYIKRQMQKPAQEAANWRTALTVGMLKDALYVHELGLNWYPDYTSTTAMYQISFGLPAGNKSQLDILDADNSTSINGSAIIDTSWDNASANIPLHVNKASAALHRRAGVHIKTIVCRTKDWDNVTNNDFVAAGHGISNPPFTQFDRQVGSNPDGSPFMAHFGRLNKCPGIDWFICDEGVELGNPDSATWASHLDEGKMFFLPEVNRNLFEGCIATEPIREYDGGPVTMKTGQAAWSTGMANPSSEEAFILDNFFPVPYNPGSWCYPTVVF